MRWITFDCFGTLVDWNGGFCAILSALAVPRAEEAVLAYHAHEVRIEAQPYRSYREVTRLALEAAARDLGIELRGAQRTALADRWSELPVFGDTVTALAQLRSDGWKLGVLTNCDDDLFAQTQERIGVRFDAVVTAQRVRSYKPALAHFEYFRDNVLAEGDAWVHAACSWFHDIAPARALGIPRVWIDREQTGDDPAAASAVLPDLTNLPAIVTGVCHPQTQH